MLVLGRLGGVLDLNVVVASYEVNLNVEHVRRHGVVVFTSCKCIFISCELEGGLEGVLVCSAFVNGVLCTTFLGVLHSHVDSHFVNACFCNGYLNGEEFALTFGAVPVTDVAEHCGRYVRGREFGDVVACPNVNSAFSGELFGKDRCEEVRLVYAVTVVIIYGSVGEYGDVTANFAHTVNDGVLCTRRNGVIGAGSGLLGSGLLGSGLFRSGLLGSGLLRSGLFGSGLFRSGLLGSGLLRSGLFGSGFCRSGCCRSGFCRSSFCRSGCCRSSFCRSGVFCRLVTSNNGQHHNNGKSQSQDASNVLVFHLENLHNKFGAGLHGNIIS